MLPNWLESRRGRLAAFFFLYVTEGIPLGFAATAVASQLRRADVGPAEIGAFVGSFYLPWAFKWAFGPLIDVFSSARWGRRRGWILASQLMMVVTLLACTGLQLPAQLGLLTAILLVHNTFGAMQDVAIDALAVSTLQADERGLANGIMFAGASVGAAVGGSGVLFLMPWLGIHASFVFVAVCIACVTLLVVLPIREAPPCEAEVRAPGLASTGRQMARFGVEAFRSFLGTQGAFAGLAFALLPAGAMALGLALQSNLAVEFGFSDDRIAWLSLWSQVLSAIFMVVGGWISDRFGRRRTLAVYLVLMSPPVLWLAWMLWQHGWIDAVPASERATRVVPAALVTALWISTLWYAVAQGLMYGTRSAIFMDVTRPSVAATQFTAYMAMMNLAIAYSATWQGIAVEAVGYPATLVIDAVFGLACLIFLPFIRPALRPEGDGAAASRARRLAAGLAMACLAWLPFRLGMWPTGQATPILETLFTLIFVASAIFLAAGGAVLGTRWSRWGVAVAPWVLAMHARHYFPDIPWVYEVIPLIAAAWLARQSLARWEKV